MGVDLCCGGFGGSFVLQLQAWVVVDLLYIASVGVVEIVGKKRKKKYCFYNILIVYIVK